MNGRQRQSDLMQLRQKADYNCAYEITEEELKSIAPIAVDF